LKKKQKTLKELITPKFKRRFLAHTRVEHKWVRDLKPGDKIWYLDTEKGPAGPMRAAIGYPGRYLQSDKRAYLSGCGCPCPEHTKLSPPVYFMGTLAYGHLRIRLEGPVTEVWLSQLFKTKKEAWQAYVDHQYDSHLENHIEFEQRMMKQEKERYDKLLKARKKRIAGSRRLDKQAERGGAIMPDKKRTKQITAWRAGGGSVYTC
jgi:hypothetical protein